MRFRPINASDKRLIAAATATLRRAYRPCRHTVAAAVRCPSGRVYTGVNVEACGYGPCAEPVAVGAAFTNAEPTFTAIVAVAKGRKRIHVIPPCGNCRQLIADYAPAATVILVNNRRVVKARARDLLPGSYISHFDP